MVSREAVIWGYRLILGREPESEAAIEAHCQLPDITTLRRGLLGSEEFVRKKMASDLPRVWVAAPVMRGERLMWLDLGDQFVSLGCLLDDYEPVETRFVRTTLQPGDVFVDVGANVGWFTLLASTIVGTQGRIYAFEPRPETGLYLEKTIKLNGITDQVTLYRYGLSDKDGEGILVWLEGTENPGGSHLADQPPPQGMESQSIRLGMLDNLKFQRVDFMKVDVEGAELRVFRGARATLERCRPVILSELSPEMLERGSAATTDEFFAFFEEIGYRCFAIEMRDLDKEVTAFPPDRSLLNLGLIPREKSVGLPRDGFATSL